MKTNLPLLCTIFLYVSLLSFQNAQGQEKRSDVKTDEFIIQSSEIVATDKAVSTIFTVNVLTDGQYYISAFAAPSLSKGQAQSVVVSVDGDEPAGTLSFLTDEWQNVNLITGKDQPRKGLSLTTGKHTIKFTSQSAFVPLVETILLSKNDRSELSAENYSRFITDLKSHKLPNDYLSIKSKGRGLRQLANPQGNYQHEFDVDFSYTYVANFYFSAGQNFTFETRNSNCDPVMYLFNRDNPLQSAWVNDGNVEATINATITQSGNYILMIRAYAPFGNTPYSGVTDLYLDGSLLSANCAVAGSSLFDNGFPPPGELNFFTADLRSSSADPRLFMIFGGNNSSSYGGQVIAYNDDYAGSGDFYWGNASRIKTGNLPNFDRSYSFLCSFSAYNPTGTCDLYMNCQTLSASEKSQYPNLKADDAIISAPANPDYTIGYNCYAWAGGVTDRVLVWREEFDYWYDNDQQTSFDNWFGNTPVPRYAGAWTYTRNSADANNAIIDLYKEGATVTHAAVRKPGNDHPHGYDWESKNGRAARFMHPRNSLEGALQNQGLGYISAYYRDSGSRGRKSANTVPNMSYEQTLQEGYSVVVKTEFTSQENEQLSKLLSGILLEDKNQFNSLYQNWRDECEKQAATIQRDEYLRTQTESYKALLGWLQTSGKRVYPLLFDRFLTGDAIDLWSRFLISDLTFPEYKSYWAEMKAMDINPKNWYNESGVYLIRHPDDNCRRYLKKILPFFTTETALSKGAKFYPNLFETSPVYKLDFSLPETSRVQIVLLDSQGAVVKTLVNGISYRSGTHTIPLDLADVKRGTYFMKISSKDLQETIRVVLNY